MSGEEFVPQRPDWLDEKFVKTCLKNDIDASSLDDITILDVKIQYAIPKGENYSSLILRLTVRYEIIDESTLQNGKHDDQITPDEKRYVIKILNSVGAMDGLKEDLSIFAREVDVYQNQFPKFETVLKEAGLDTKLACRCVHHCEEKGVIIMEDLGAQNYVLADRIIGADLEHCKVTFNKFARLHAASMKYYEQNTNKIPDYFYKGMIRHIEDEKTREAIDSFFGPKLFKKKVGILAEQIRKVPGYEKEAEIIEKLKDHAHDLLCDVYKHKPGNIMNAHLHGDCWINNMLYKYDDEGRPVDVALLDMQCSNINPVACDFLAFFLTSASDEVRQHHYQELLNFYYEKLIETLDIVNYKGVRPTLNQLKEEILATSPMFLLSTAVGLPLIKRKVSKADDRSKDESISFENVIQQMAKYERNPVFEKTLFVTLDLLRELGVFEYHEELLRSMKSDQNVHI